MAFLKIAVVLALWGIFGILVGEPCLCLFIASLLMLMVRQWELSRVSAWVLSSGNEAPPRIGRAWTAIIDSVRKLERSVRKRKRKLGRSHKAFQEAMSALPDGIVVLDKDLNLEWWNTAATRPLE